MTGLSAHVQDVPDTVKQAVGKEPIPPRGVPNPETDEFTRNEPAFRYGYGARSHYRNDFRSWDDKVEGKLKTEWNDLKSGRAWDEVKGFVRRGWDYQR